MQLANDGQAEWLAHLIGITLCRHEDGKEAPDRVSAPDHRRAQKPDQPSRHHRHHGKDSDQQHQMHKEQYREAHTQSGQTHGDRHRDSHPSSKVRDSERERERDRARHGDRDRDRDRDRERDRDRLRDRDWDRDKDQGRDMEIARSGKHATASDTCNDQQGPDAPSNGQAEMGSSGKDGVVLQVALHKPWWGGC